MPLNRYRFALLGIALSGIIQLLAFAEPLQFLIESKTLSNATAISNAGEAIRSRRVTVDLAAFPKAMSSSVMRLNLFEDNIFDVYLEILRKPDDDTFTWSGILSDDPLSSVTISVADDVVQGNVHSPVHGEFQIRYVRNGIHEAREIDPLWN